MRARERAALAAALREVLESFRTMTSACLARIDAQTRSQLGALPPPLAGEGWGGGLSLRGPSCVPPPCPSPASGGGDAVAPIFAPSTPMRSDRRARGRGQGA